MSTLNMQQLHGLVRTFRMSGEQHRSAAGVEILSPHMPAGVLSRPISLAYGLLPEYLPSELGVVITVCLSVRWGTLAADTAKVTTRLPRASGHVQAATTAPLGIAVS